MTRQISEGHDGDNVVMVEMDVQGGLSEMMS